jgi:hypothetical protein
LKLKCDEPLSDFAFKFNLRRYTVVTYLHGTKAGPLYPILWDTLGGVTVSLAVTKTAQVELKSGRSASP